MDISFPFYQYNMAYLGTLSIKNDNSKKVSTLVIKIIKEIIINKLLPIDPNGLYATKINLDTIIKIFKKLITDNDKYPILLVYNSDYGREKPKSNSIKIFFLAGISLKENDLNDKDKIYYVLGYSRWRDNNGNKATKCSNTGNCKLYFVLVLSKDILDSLPKEHKINIRIEKYEKNKKGQFILEAEDIRIFATKYRDAKVHLRSFIIDREANSSSQTQIFSLNDTNLQIYYLGAQISIKGQGYRIQNGRKEKEKYIYFMLPLIVAYSVKFPQVSSSDNSANIGLPKDYVFESGKLKMTINNYNWNKVVELVDWLWNHHRASIFKLFLSKDINDSIYKYLSALKNSNSAYGTFSNIEFRSTLEFYNYYLIYYSLNLTQALNLYNKFNKSHSKLEDLILDVFDESKSLSLNYDQVLTLKKIIGFYALMYGLHGISHLLMKALTKITGIKHFGELINIRVPADQQNPSLLNYLTVVEFSNDVTLQKKKIFYENTFQIESEDSGENFNLEINVFSKEKYSYNLLNNIYNNTNFIDELKKSINDILFKQTNTVLDRCNYNWTLEKQRLEYARQKFIQRNNALNQADNEVKNYINTHYKPSRTIFRFIYANKLVYDISKKLNIGKNDLYTYSQYIWPYYLDQCVDGCYNCVYIEGELGNNYCDMNPLSQELKTSKWSAVYILKDLGLINVDIDNISND